jgi:lipopolysaccharide heptosyltransferase I
MDLPGERNRTVSLGKQRIPLAGHPARRIALLKPSALGDIIHSLPVLTALRRRYPDAHITWIVNRAYEPLLNGHPHLNATLPFDRGVARKGWLRAAKAYGGFLAELRRQRFDLVLDLQGLLRSGLICMATGATRRVGLSTSREGARWFYTDVVPVPDFNALHAVDRYWLIAEALGAGKLPKSFVLPESEEARAWALEKLQGCARPWLMAAVGSRWMTKRWPPAHFAALLNHAQERFGGTAVFVGGGGDRSIAGQTATQLSGAFRDLTGTTSLPQLAAVLALADVMLANDTGPLHLAAALGRPIVAPYTCTKIQLNGPYGAEAGARETKVWCQGSYLKRCSRLECMAELTPGRLQPILQEILQTWQRRCRSA